jgi:hypothetical protein
LCALRRSLEELRPKAETLVDAVGHRIGVVGEERNPSLALVQKQLSERSGDRGSVSAPAQLRGRIHETDARARVGQPFGVAGDGLDGGALGPQELATARDVAADALLDFLGILFLQRKIHSLGCRDCERPQIVQISQGRAAEIAARVNEGLDAIQRIEGHFPVQVSGS